MITIQNINKRFKKLQALDNINAAFNKGQVISLIGPNGSGKTTLIKSILGLVKPDSGSIHFNGAAVTEEVAYRKNIGYMPQIGQYPASLRMSQLFEMMKGLRPDVKNTEEELIDAFGLRPMMDKRMYSLSGGTRQKVSAALAFLFRPHVYILDEPTAGLDPVAVEVLKEKLLHEKQSGKLFIITSHILSDLEDIVTDMVYLFEGSIRYNSAIEDLKKETQESTFAKAIASLIRTQDLQIKELVTS